MKRRAACSAYYRYPVELVWKAIGFGSDAHTVDPMNEDDYNRKEPGPGVVFTRALEVKTNEVFAFQMKTQTFFADWRIELSPLGPCDTKARISAEMQFRTGKAAALGMLMSMRREVRTFAKDLGKKMEEQNKRK